MDLANVLHDTGGLESLEREFGISKAQATAAAGALLPAILGGFKKQAHAQPGGVGDLLGMLNGFGGGDLLDEVLRPQPTNAQAGNDVLGEIFGSREVSRSVAQHAAVRTGLEPSLLKRMLPVVAMMAAGYLSRQGQAPVGSQPAMRANTQAHHGLADLLDLNGDGNPLDDVLNIANSLLR